MTNKLSKFCLRYRKKREENMRPNSVVLTPLLVLLFVGISLEVARATLSAAECHEERRIGVNACKQVLHGKLPSPDCCERVRVTHIECVCPVVTPKLAALIDVNRAIRLIEGCGRRVPRHYKCGSITTP